MQEQSSNKRGWIKYLATAAGGLVVAFFICWMKGIFQATEPKAVVRIICDAVTMVGLLYTCFGFLTVLNKAGVFDGLGYSLKSMIRVLRNYPENDKTPKTYYDYKKAKYEKRKRQWFLVIVGAGYLIVSIVLVIVHELMQ